MLRNLMNLNHPLYNFMRKMGWVFVFNIVFMLTMIPIVTAPASLTACTSVFLLLTDEQSRNWAKVYWCQFTGRFFISLFYGFLLVVTAFIWYLDILYFLQAGPVMKYVGLTLSALGILISVVLFQGIFVMLAKFHYGIRDTFRAQILFMRLEPLRCLLAAGMFLIFFGGCVFAVFRIQPLAFLVIFFFGIGFFVTAYGYNAVFYRYLNREEDEYDFTDEELYDFNALCIRIERYLS